MRSEHLSFAALAGCIAMLAGCAAAGPEPEPVAQGAIPEPSMQKCSTSTGSRIPTTCSSMVKSTSNTEALREMQRHSPMKGGN